MFAWQSALIWCCSFIPSSQNPTELRIRLLTWSWERPAPSDSHKRSSCPWSHAARQTALGCLADIGISHDGTIYLKVSLLLNRQYEARESPRGRSPPRLSCVKCVTYLRWFYLAALGSRQFVFIILSSRRACTHRLRRTCWGLRHEEVRDGIDRRARAWAGEAGWASAVPVAARGGGRLCWGRRRRGPGAGAAAGNGPSTGRDSSLQQTDSAQGDQSLFLLSFSL